MVRQFTLDEELEIKKDQWLDPTYSTTDAMEASKATLCSLIHRERFEEALQLYDLIVNTGIFEVSAYWKTGLQLAKKNNRDAVAYLETVHRVCLDKQKKNIFLAYINELIENDRADAAKENIQDIWVTIHGNDPDVQAVLSLLEAVESPEKRQEYVKERFEHIPRESSFWPEWFPTDEQIASEYLSVLSEANEEEMKKAALFVLQRGGQLNNLKLMRAALQFYRPSTTPFLTWVNLMLPFHCLDPGADYRLFAEPYVEGAIKGYGHDLNHASSYTVYHQIYLVIKDRLVALWYDQWALKKLAWLCRSFLNIERPERRIKFLRMIESEDLYEYLHSRRSDIHDQVLAEMKREYYEYDRKTFLTLLSKLDGTIVFLDKMCALLKKVQTALDIENQDKQQESNKKSITRKKRSRKQLNRHSSTRNHHS